jgi:DNA invertase Pin-like site-specific DNA recombinase
MEIVQEYSDHGQSGLNIAGREGLNQLMADVGAKRANFTSLLVYDVRGRRLAQGYPLQLMFADGVFLRDSSNIIHCVPDSDVNVG